MYGTMYGKCMARKEFASRNYGKCMAMPCFMYGKFMAAAAMCGVLPQKKARIFRAFIKTCGKLFMLF